MTASMEASVSIFALEVLLRRLEGPTDVLLDLVQDTRKTRASVKKTGIFTQDFDVYSRITDKNGQLGKKASVRPFSGPYSLLLCTLPGSNRRGRFYFWLVKLWGTADREIYGHEVILG